MSLVKGGGTQIVLFWDLKRNEPVHPKSLSPIVEVKKVPSCGACVNWVPGFHWQIQKKKKLRNAVFWTHVHMSVSHLFSYNVIPVHGGSARWVPRINCHPGFLVILDNNGITVHLKRDVSIFLRLGSRNWSGELGNYLGLFDMPNSNWYNILLIVSRNQFIKQGYNYLGEAITWDSHLITAPTCKSLWT